MFKRIKPSFEKNSGILHKDYQVRETRVSDYMRKYGTGHADPNLMPQDRRVEVTDEREVDDMLDMDSFEPSLGTDELDVLSIIESNRDKFAKMVEDIKMTKRQRIEFDDAMKVLNDVNATYESKQKALSVLDELEQKKVISRARS